MQWTEQKFPVRFWTYNSDETLVSGHPLGQVVSTPDKTFNSFIYAGPDLNLQQVGNHQTQADAQGLVEHIADLSQETRQALAADFKRRNNL